ncbi:MAG: hypothetical protein ACPGSB_09410, partial [Opitutales bacterium]
MSQKKSIFFQMMYSGTLKAPSRCLNYLTRAGDILRLTKSVLSRAIQASSFFEVRVICGQRFE